MLTKNKTKFNPESGFTLIELLVVIAIIGLIATIAVTALAGARGKARDARRIADIKQINSAIQFYINANGHAPYVGTYNCNETLPYSGCDTVTDPMTDHWNQLAADLAPYLPRLPKDPCGGGPGCQGGDGGAWYAYAYLTPSGVATYCDQVPGCNLNQQQLAEGYSIYAQRMESASPSLIYTSNGYPTYGFIAHLIGGNSF